ncbi:hypothetical protein IPG36_07995 [bacterium]|nr:MAG: hypothetical protein IPG36_07995 [bacterium]
MKGQLLAKIPKFRSKDTGPRKLVALDIGTEFVKALIGEVVMDPSSGAPASVNITGVGRQRQRLTDMQSGTVTDIAGVVENCDAALKIAEKWLVLQSPKCPRSLVSLENSSKVPLPRCATNATNRPIPST